MNVRPGFQKDQRFQIDIVAWRTLSQFSDTQPKMLRRQRSDVRIISGAPVFSISGDFGFPLPRDASPSDSDHRKARSWRLTANAVVPRRLPRHRYGFDLTAKLRMTIRIRTDSAVRAARPDDHQIAHRVQVCGVARGVKRLLVAKLASRLLRSRALMRYRILTISRLSQA